MKTTKSLKYAVYAFFALGVIATSCSSGDIHDVYEGPAAETDNNPLSSLNPSANFSWSTMDYATITIEVDDQFNSEFDYVAHVYTVDPTADSEALPIYSCVITGDASATSAVNIPAYSDKLYVMLTDPENVTTLYTYDAPAANSSVSYTCSEGDTIIDATRTISVPATRIEGDIDGAYSAGYTINFEDQWPSIGDYDLNDVILRVKSIETVQGKNNQVESATMTFELEAVGATHTLGIGLQFDEIDNSSIKNIVHSHRDLPGLKTTDPGAFDIQSNTDLREDGGGNLPVIIPLAYDAHKVFLNSDGIGSRTMLNTGAFRIPGREFTIDLEFNGNKVEPAHFNISSLNFFIYRVNDDLATQNERVEIHMKGYEPTRSASAHYFGTDDDDFNRYYTTVDNFPWAVVVNDVSNEPWAWPRESTLITSSYPHFADWVNGNGAEDWMIP